MTSHPNDTEAQPPGQRLCTSCGLCCQGVFHSHVDLKTTADLEIAAQVNATVIAVDPPEGHFTLPCPAFAGQCTIYPRHPDVCKGHQCKVLDGVLDHTLSLEEGFRITAAMKTLGETLVNDLLARGATHSSRMPENLIASLAPELEEKAALSKLKREAPGLLLKYFSFKAWRRRFYDD